MPCRLDFDDCAYEGKPECQQRQVLNNCYYCKPSAIPQAGCEAVSCVADTESIVGPIEKYANSLKDRNVAKHILDTCKQLRFLLDKTF